MVSTASIQFQEQERRMSCLWYIPSVWYRHEQRRKGTFRATQSALSDSISITYIKSIMRGSTVWTVALKWRERFTRTPLLLKLLPVAKPKLHLPAEACELRYRTGHRCKSVFQLFPDISVLRRWCNICCLISTAIVMKRLKL